MICVFLLKVRKSMENYEERISLLHDMIAFSVVDGMLHKKEYEFLWMIASDLKIDKTTFDGMFHREDYPTVVRSEFERIKQFYRLALLMHIDGILHEKEETTIAQACINMGLNPAATRRILQLMKQSPDRVVDADTLFAAFRAQQN